MKKSPQVNEVNEFLETASDFEDPLEVIRESLSNSYDAQATNVEIEISSHPNGSEIIIEDNGTGMNRQQLETFFDLGNSQKTDSIGYKGHGTKIFYKSERIVVTTTTGDTTLRATMERPWEKLNDRVLPEYEVTEVEPTESTDGTEIRIEGFKSGQGFDPRSLTYNKIHHYLKWKTIAGSTAHYFGEEEREMEIRVVLDEEIDDTQSELQTTNRLEFPSEQLRPSTGEFPAERMCKIYPPQELTIPHDGGTTTAQVVGMVGGKAARNELPTYGKHSAQFGVWLAKDFIKVERVNEAISHDNEFLHFFFIANCQELELSANRGKIRNKSSPVYQALVDELDHFLSKVGEDPWFKDYLEQRRIAELDRKAESQLSSVEERRERVKERNSFEPTNQAEVLLALERSNSSAETVQAEDFQMGSDINAMIRKDGELWSCSLHPTLMDHFEAEKPLQSVEKIVCWDLGDRDQLQEIERDGYQGGEVIFDFAESEIIYKNGTTSRIEIIEVQERF
ncbi:ATP-binding protein [Halosimplex salinum]|uniref:ATP-binding protein n=1 Tax=Halosimplex salinum TaxID=1710538 RepID=UPI000F463B86|nr:ATP-binding protein [Halosimplex salinum]